jgi:hypothetical protein
MKTLLALLLCTGAALAQQQTITTFGANQWPQTTVISPTAGGYNYTTWNNGPRSGQWGGVTAAPGTTVSAAVTARGEIVPIVTPKADPLVEMATLSAPSYDLPPMPPIPRRAPTATTKEAHGEIPPPASYSTNTYGQYAWLHNQLTSDAMKQLAADWKRDTGLDKDARINTHALLGYLRLWVRSHPGCLSGYVAGNVSPTPLK